MLLGGPLRRDEKPSDVHPNQFGASHSSPSGNTHTGIKGTRGRSNSIFEPPHHPGNHSKVFWYVLFVCLFSRFGRAGCTSLAPAMLAIACNDMHLHSNVTKHDRTNNHGGLAPQRLHGMSHGHGASMCTGQKIQPRPPTDIMQM